MDKYKNKYRVGSHRKPNWDYSADALYFLTIVTQNRACILGEIVSIIDDNGNATNEMVLSDFGKIVEREWLKSFDIRHELILHHFVIMPNHIHTIVEIKNENRDGLIDGNDYRIDDGNVGNDDTVEAHGRGPLRYHHYGRGPLHIYPTTSESPMDNIPSIKRNPPIRLPQSISSFVAGFKSAVNTEIDNFIDERGLNIPKYNRHNHFFQPNYHDHIIRNMEEYRKISIYITNNPKNWDRDTFR